MARHGAKASGRDKPPQVTATCAKGVAERASPCRSVSSNVPSACRSTPCTSQPVRSSTPTRCKCVSRALTTVSDCCEAGKTRPSASTRSGTPIDSHHCMRVFGGVARSRRLIRRAPRGYTAAMSSTWAKVLVTLHRPPPVLRTLASGVPLRSKITTGSCGKSVLRRSASRQPAAPPPRMAVDMGREKRGEW